jgi:hypothetical protein
MAPSRALWGSGFNEIGGLHGTVSDVQHLATDAATVLAGSLSGLNLSLSTLADAISPSNLSDDFYQLAGQGNNTLTGSNAQVGSTNDYYINFDATAGNDTINGTSGGGNTIAIRFADYGDAPAAVQVDLVSRLSERWFWHRCSCQYRWRWRF